MIGALQSGEPSNGIHFVPAHGSVVTSCAGPPAQLVSSTGVAGAGAGAEAGSGPGAGAGGGALAIKINC